MLINRVENFTEYYKRAHESAVKLACQYDGSERSYNQLLSVLLELENQLYNITALPRDRGIDDSTERRIYHSLIGYKPGPITIDEIIDTASNAFILGTDVTSLPQEIAERFNMHFRELSGVVGVPDEGAVIDRGNGGQLLTPKLQPRIQIILSELNKIGVFTDDIHMRYGDSLSGWRYPGYAVLEIPRLGFKNIMVSNQVGEGVRLSTRPLSDEAYTERSKRQLDLISSVTAVIWNNADQWWQSIKGLLDVENIHPKISIEDLEQFRLSTKTRWSLAEFLNLSLDEVLSLKVEETPVDVFFKGYIAPDNWFSEAARLQLAEIVYGYDRVSAYYHKQPVTELSPPNYLTYDGNWRAYLFDKLKSMSAEEVLERLEQESFDPVNGVISRLFHGCGFSCESKSFIRWACAEILGESKDQKLSLDIPPSTFVDFPPINETSKAWRSLPYNVFYHKFLLDFYLDQLGKAERLGQALMKKFNISEQVNERVKQRPIDLYSLSSLYDQILEVINKDKIPKPSLIRRFLQLARMDQSKLKQLELGLTATIPLMQETLQSWTKQNPEYSSIDFLTPVSVDPRWGLSAVEARVFQMLANYGIHGCPAYILANFFDKAALSSNLEKGPVNKIVQQINRKLAIYTDYVIERRTEPGLLWGGIDYRLLTGMRQGYVPVCWFGIHSSDAPSA